MDKAGRLTPETKEAVQVKIELSWISRLSWRGLVVTSGCAGGGPGYVLQAQNGIAYPPPQITS